MLKLIKSSSWLHTPATQQPDRELGELAERAVDLDRSAMLLRYNELIDRPSPVPSPVGLVVKNGWNNLSRNSGGIPVPLSRTRISTASPRSFVVTFSTGRKPSPASWRRLSVA